MGYSGSTLMDLMLNNHEKIQSVGELMFLDKWLSENLTCSCKKQICECDFWKKAISLTGVKDFRLSSDILKKFPRRNFENLITKSTLNPSVLKNLAWRYYQITSSVRSVSNAEYILDSSKQIANLKVYANSNLFNLHVIHLIRNGLAVLKSNRNSKPMPSYSKNKRTPTISPIRSSYRWVSSNLILERLAKSCDFKYKKIRYEDLALDSKTVMADIYKWLNLYPAENLTSPITEHIHNIAGSRWRFKDKVEIQVDNSGLNATNFLEKAIFKLIGGRLNKKYGY